MNIQPSTAKVPVDPYAFKKYRPGVVLRTFEQVLDAAARSVWLFHGDKAVHPGWYSHWSLHMIKNRLDGGHLRLAIRNKTFPLIFNALWLPEFEPGSTPIWCISCAEIPRLNVELSVIGMTSIINHCYGIARKRGHFGPVHVTFEKDAPF